MSHVVVCSIRFFVFFFKQKTAYEMRISDWSSDVCSSDLDRITPNAAEWDEKHIFPRDVIKEAADLGFAAIYVSEESGGIALGRLESALIMEAMAYGCPSTSAFISIHNMASWLIDRFGPQPVDRK